MNLTDLERLPDRELIAALRVLQLGIDGDEATFALLPAETTALTAVVDAGEGSVDTLDAKRDVSVFWQCQGSFFGCQTSN